MTKIGHLFKKLTGNASVSNQPLAVPAMGASTRRRASAGTPIDPEASFRFPAAENMVGDTGSEHLLRIIKAFAPSQPTQGIAQFAGRTPLLSQVITAIEEHRNHLVIFGGRGTGKTSLAMALSSVARRVGYHCAYVSCSRESTVTSIFRSAMTDLPIRYDQYFDPRDDKIDPALSFEALIPEGNLPPQALADILARIRGTRLLVVIDEFDRNENPTLTRDLTEIMKVVSDRDIPVQIVVVGVGDVVDNLVGEHTSIARVLYVVRLTPMSDDEIRDTLTLAGQLAGIQMAPDVISSIIAISHGRPYIARLVGLKAAKMALLRSSSVIQKEDFDAGTDELLGYLDSAGFGQPGRMIGITAMNQALFAAMLKCKRDSNDRFTLQDVCAALPWQSAANDLAGTVQRALDIIASPQYGLLNVYAGDKTYYQFVDPRAELCISILCGRAVSNDTGAPAAAEPPRQQHAAR